MFPSEQPLRNSLATSVSQQEAQLARITRSRSRWPEGATRSTRIHTLSEVSASRSQAVGQPVPPEVNLEAPIVLEYHAVNTDPATATPETGATVSLEHLEQIARGIADSDQPNDYLITFDDGYRDNYEAFKALQERGINLRGVVSVISDATRGSGEGDALDSHLSGAELREMAAAGSRRSE